MVRGEKYDLWYTFTLFANNLCLQPIVWEGAQISSSTDGYQVPLGLWASQYDRARLIRGSIRGRSRCQAHWGAQAVSFGFSEAVQPLMHSSAHLLARQSESCLALDAGVTSRPAWNKLSFASLNNERKSHQPIDSVG